MTACWVVRAYIVYGGVAEREGEKGTLEEQITKKFPEKTVIIH